MHVQIVVDIAVLSDDALRYCASSGLLYRITDELDQKDILLRLNCLELLVVLAIHHHGLRFLEEHGIVARLEQEMSKTEADPLSNFLLPGTGVLLH